MLQSLQMSKLKDGGLEGSIGGGAGFEAGGMSSLLQEAATKGKSITIKEKTYTLSADGDTLELNLVMIALKLLTEP
jgi:hypothetical protein